SDTTRKAVRRGADFVITTKTKAGTTERKVAPPKKTLGLARRLDDWLVSTPKKGATFDTFGLSLEEKDVNLKEVYTFLSKQTVAWGGKPTEVYHVTVLARGARQEADIRQDGTPIRLKMGPLDVRAEPEAVAKKPGDTSVDFMALSSIRCDKDLGTASRVEALTLEVDGLGDFAMPTSHRQNLRREKGKAVLELRRDFRTGKKEPLSKAD